MSKIVPIHQTENYAVVSAKHIAQAPISGQDPVGRLLSLWCGFYEELLAAGYRPLHRLQRPEAVLCEKLNELNQIRDDIIHLRNAVRALGESHEELRQAKKPKAKTAA